MGQERYTQETRLKIIMAQNPVEHLELNGIKCGLSLIASGREWGNPGMVRKGARMVIKIRMRQFARFMRRPLKPLDMSLLAERRTKFIRQIKESRND